MPRNENHKAKHAAYMRKWRKTHRLTAEQRWKDNCRSYAAVYVKRGKIKRQGCEVCGEQAEMHHDDYSKPLDIRWFCKKHHVELHYPWMKVFHDKQPVATRGGL